MTATADADLIPARGQPGPVRAGAPPYGLVVVLVVALALAAIDPFLWAMAIPTLIFVGVAARRPGNPEPTRLVGLAALVAGIAMLVVAVLAGALLLPASFDATVEQGPVETVPEPR
jgi:hypothetical protein